MAHCTERPEQGSLTLPAEKVAEMTSLISTGKAGADFSVQKPSLSAVGEPADSSVFWCHGKRWVLSWWAEKRTQLPLGSQGDSPCPRLSLFQNSPTWAIPKPTSSRLRGLEMCWRQKRSGARYSDNSYSQRNLTVPEEKKKQPCWFTQPWELDLNTLVLELKQR